MEQRSIGKSGLRVSLVGLGCNNFGRRIDANATQRVVHKALDFGITLFDTADIYRGPDGDSEDLLGRALGARRNEVVLATKGGMPMDADGKLQGASRHYLMSAVEASLRRLKTDWIDLYQLHRPDRVTPVEETLRAFDDLVRQGKVRYIGCSNHAAWEIVEAQWTSRLGGLEHFVSFQNEYSLLARGVEQELLPMARAYGIGLLPFYPLASGLLTGKYKRGAPMPEGARLNAHGSRYGDRFINETNWPIVEKLQAFCEKRGKSLLELAFSWLAAQELVSSVIAGATNPEQVALNANAVSWDLTPDDLEEVNKITTKN